MQVPRSKYLTTKKEKQFFWSPSPSSFSLDSGEPPRCLLCPALTPPIALHCRIASYLLARLIPGSSETHLFVHAL